MIQIPETKETLMLYRRTASMSYCAFPSLMEWEDYILCAFKQGTNHGWDHGTTSYFFMKRNSEIRGFGTPIDIPDVNTQNAELVRMADGTVYCYLDIQAESEATQRLGVRTYVYRDHEFHALPGMLHDTDGRPYGYVFDGINVGTRAYLLAMTFPELDERYSDKQVHLLTSDDNGITWQSLCILDPLSELHLNESTLAWMNGKLYVLCRAYEAQSCMLVLDEDGNLCGKRRYGEDDRILNVGRPKLFVRDGALYGIERNHQASGSPMTLEMFRYDPETLAFTHRVMLDDTAPRDGYYAEPYFDDDGGTLCVVTYKITDQSTPDLVLMRFTWDEIR